VGGVIVDSKNTGKQETRKGQKTRSNERIRLGERGNGREETKGEGGRFT